MIDGHVDTISRDRISGWAADLASPDESIDIIITVNGAERATVRADCPRPDLQQLGTYGDGLHGFQFTFDVPLSAEQDHEVVVHFGSDERILRHGRALVPMDEKEVDAVRSPPVVYAPERGQLHRGDVRQIPRYIIHVGPHKTGTKYLQKGLYRLRGLLFQYGVAYPTQWSDKYNKSHSHLLQRLRDHDPHLQAEFAALNASAYQTMILSSEDMVDLPNDALVYLKDLLDGQSVMLVFYCRRWSELIPSAWQEVVKQGSSQCLPEFLAGHLINPVGSSIVNYDHALGRLSHIFGSDALQLVSYNNLAERDADLLKHFLETFVNWSAPESAAPERENTSLNILDVELIRVLNAMEIARRGISSYNTVCARYLEMKPKLDIGPIHYAMQGDIQEIEINEASVGLRMVHEVIFERYANRVVHPRSGFNLFALRANNVRFIGQSYLLADGIVDAITRVYQAIDGAPT